MAMGFHFGECKATAPFLGHYSYHHCVISLWVSKIVIRGLARVCSPLRLRSLIDGAFRPGVIVRLPAANGSVGNYRTIVLEVGNAL